MGVNPLYYQEEYSGNVELLGEYRAEVSQTECLADQILAGVLGLESGVTLA